MAGRKGDAPEATPFSAFAAATGLGAREAEAAFLALWKAGFVVLPLEPTKGMLAAGQTEQENCIDSDWDSGPDGSIGRYTTIAPDAPLRIYRAMLDEVYPDDGEDA